MATFNPDQINPTSPLVKVIRQASMLPISDREASKYAAMAANESLQDIQSGELNEKEKVSDVLNVFDTFVSLKPRIPIPEDLLDQVNQVLDHASNQEFMRGLSSFTGELKDKLNSPACTKKQRKAHLEDLLSVSNLIRFLSKDKDRNLLDKPKCLNSVRDIVKSINEVEYKDKHEADLIISKNTAAEIAIKTLEMPGELDEFIAKYFMDATVSNIDFTHFGELMNCLDEDNRGSYISVDWGNAKDNTDATFLLQRLFSFANGIELAKNRLEAEIPPIDTMSLRMTLSKLEKGSIFMGANSGVTLNDSQNILFGFIKNMFNRNARARYA